MPDKNNTGGFNRSADAATYVNGELDGLETGFERIKIPSADSTVFEVSGGDGKPEAVKAFSAVILYHHTLFAYYKTRYTGGNAPPDCGSFDGVTGEGDPGGSCKACPFNEFGTGEHGSKACKNRRRIYLLREGDIFPLLLSLPTGSLNEFSRYIRRLLSGGHKSNTVVTRFSIQTTANSAGLPYSQARFEAGRELTGAEQGYIDKLSEWVKAHSGRVGFGSVNGGDVDV